MPEKPEKSAGLRCVCSNLTTDALFVFFVSYTNVKRKEEESDQSSSHTAGHVLDHGVRVLKAYKNSVI
jgi:hypothetical protein